MPVKDSGGGLLAELAGRVSGQAFDITVGVHSDDADHTHGTGEGNTIGDIATWMEFGTQTVPQRSFIRGWFDERQPEIQATLKQELRQAVQGKRPLAQALERAALRLEGSVKDRIRQHIPPPLSPATVKRKGSSTPLIDTGALRNAIRARVGVGGGNGTK